MARALPVTFGYCATCADLYATEVEPELPATPEPTEGGPAGTDGPGPVDLACPRGTPWWVWVAIGLGLGYWAND